MSTRQPKIFISYSSIDEDFAELVKLKLQNAGIEVWKDTTEIAAGEEWRKGIDAGLLGADTIVVLLNKNSINSGYVTYEWAFALGSGKNIIPVVMEECEIHPRIKVLQYFDFKNKKRPWDSLVERIKNVSVKDANSKIKVSELTVEELERLLSGSKSLADATVKSEGRETGVNDVSAAANQLVNAKYYLNSQSNLTNTILWVDDLPDNNINEREAFKTIGFDFDLALSTDEALEFLSRRSYAAIISDMSRVEGQKEGYKLLEEVRQIDKDIPYFIYASSNAIEHKIEASERGAQGCTNSPAELIDLVTTHIHPAINN